MPAATSAPTSPSTATVIEDLAYRRLLEHGTHAEAAALVDRLAGGVPELLPHRESMRAIKVLALADLVPGPRDPRRREVTGRLLDHLDALQGPSGLFDGDNLISPPDTAFTINDLCLTVELLRSHGHGHGHVDADHHHDVVERLRTIAARAVDALVRGGVHTPNHRWELASALAGLHDVAPHPGLLTRVDEWLAEGVDIDGDGFYSERSPNYAAYVTNPSLLTIARLLDRPDLRDHVRRNLRATLALVDDDGEVETVQSRRQDQRERFGAHSYLSQLRWFAVHDHDRDLARVVTQVLANGPVVEASRHLAETLVDPVLRQPLPPPAEASPRVTSFPAVGLVRRRGERTSTSVFGGSDFPATGRIASGLANSATVLRYRHGRARLRSLRVSPDFFDTGAFRPAALAIDARTVVLEETRTTGYYQPLAPEHRSADGSYRLTDDGRFFAEMSFPLRDRDDLALTTTMTVALREDDGVDVEVRFTGIRTRFAVELVFDCDGEGVLRGAEDHPDDASSSWWRAEVLRYVAGKDAIEMRCSGHDAHRPPRFGEGEVFGYVGGRDAVPGRRVLLGGWTDQPLHLQIRGAREDRA